MDETFYPYLHFPTSTIGHLGNESTQILYDGNEKQGFTVIFCINADGTFMKPIMIKKGKTLRCLTKVDTQDKMQKCFSNNGWVNCGIMIELLKNIYDVTKGLYAVLILDMYPTHVDDFVTKDAAEKNITLVYVPAGLTGSLQPLDVGINGPLKAKSKKIFKRKRIENENYKIDLNGAIQNLNEAIDTTINERIVISAFNNALQLGIQHKKNDENIDNNVPKNADGNVVNKVKNKRMSKTQRMNDSLKYAEVKNSAKPL